MSRRILLCATLIAAAAACGHKTKTTTAIADEHGDHEHEMHEGGESGLPPTVAAFHDRMAPLWHADPGAERTQNTCAATGDLVKLVDGIDEAGVPDGVDPPAWGGNVAGLRDALAKLTADCEQSQGAAIDTTFPPVHMAFHSLIELLPPASDPK